MGLGCSTRKGRSQIRTICVISQKGNHLKGKKNACLVLRRETFARSHCFLRPSMLQLSVVAEPLGCCMGLGDNPFQYGSTGGFWVYGRKVLLGMICLRRGIASRVDIASLHRDIQVEMPSRGARHPCGRVSSPCGFWVNKTRR